MNEYITKNKMATGSDVIKNQLHRSVLNLVSLERARKDDSEYIYMFMSKQDGGRK